MDFPNFAIISHSEICNCSFASLQQLHFLNLNFLNFSLNTKLNSINFHSIARIFPQSSIEHSFQYLKSFSLYTHYALTFSHAHLCNILLCVFLQFISKVHFFPYNLLLHHSMKHPFSYFCISIIAQNNYLNSIPGSFSMFFPHSINLIGRLILTFIYITFRFSFPANVLLSLSFLPPFSFLPCPFVSHHLLLTLPKK